MVQMGGEKMLELKLGFMTTQELANWSGKTLENLHNHKKKWCETQLVKYATFELVRGGVNIIQIINPIYETSGKKEVEKKFDKYWGHDDIKIDSGLNCWNKINFICRYNKR